MSFRDDALEAASWCCPSKYPDAIFQEMTGGKFQPGFGSSCGFLTSYVLLQIGVRDERILNRDVPEYGLKYTPGDNISRLVNGGKTLGAWRTVENDGEPLPGDLVFCSNGPANTEHVFCFRSSDGVNWNSYDGGHPSADEANEATRPLLSGARLSFFGGPRKIVGYVDISALDAPARDTLIPAALAVACGGALGALALFYLRSKG